MSNKSNEKSHSGPPMKRLFVVVFFFAALVSLNAQSFFSRLEYSLRGSILFFLEDNGAASAPMPILPAPGFSTSFTVNDLLALELSLDLYGTEYDYDYNLNRAVPANQEFRTSFIVGTLWGVQPVFRFRPWGDKITIRAYGGPAFDIRICLPASDVKGNHQQTGKPLQEASGDIASYMWGDGRWFFLFAGGGVDRVFFESIRLGLDLRAWFPVWRLWTGEDAPFVEGFRLGIGFRATF